MGDGERESGTQGAREVGSEEGREGEKKREIHREREGESQLYSGARAREREQPAAGTAHTFRACLQSPHACRDS